MSLGPTLSGWQAFERLQRYIENRNLAAESVACEDALSALLDKFDADDLPGEDDVNRRFYSLRRNRARKHRRRDALLRRSACPDRVDQRQRLDDADELRHCQSHTSTAEWRLIEDVATMGSYASLASKMGTTAGQLRTRVSRLRARLKSVV